ncbi:MAG: SulP family inorganic anion transporter [Hyphomicrobiales bacterium]|nr:SulP family inorganic anion transporter [Hyphomicrobiales bacterium]
MVGRDSLRADAIAGLTGATIVLPQGIAFAAIAGLPPVYGFYTALVVPIVAALFGSSWHLVSGPTTAISALVFAALSGQYTPGSNEFIQAAVLLAIMVGVFQVLLGIARMGALIDFVSHSVMIGFTAGAAILIGLSQLRHALGVELPRPEKLVSFLSVLPEALPQTNWRAILIAGVAVAVSLAVRAYRSGWPNYLFALVAASFTGFLVDAKENGVALVGEITAVLPTFSLPAVSFAEAQMLAEPAFAIALIGLLEAVSIARALAAKAGQDLNSNQEFVGQGLSNMVGGLFQCYAASGSFTRSGVNYEAGARTPMAAIFSSIFLGIILLFVAKWFAYVPIPAMAGIIMVVAYKLIDFKELKHIFSASRSETTIVAGTFLTTLLINLEFAVYAGVLLSLMFFVSKTSRPSFGIGAPDPSRPMRTFRDATMFNLPECPQIIITKIEGPFYFGSVEFIRRRFRAIERARPNQKHMLFVTSGTGEIDMAAASLLIEEAHRRKKRGGSFHVQCKSPRAISRFDKFHVPEQLSGGHTHVSKHDAIHEMVALVDLSICAKCKTRIFRECPEFLEPDNASKAGKDADTATDTAKGAGAAREGSPAAE